VAAIIVEPVGGNAGCIPPKGTFLADLRGLCDRHGALLIFDEVMTGFRIARGGAAERFGVIPDLYTFGKVIGGGFPIGAYAGQKSLMQQIAPSGPVYQAGTLSGNPVAVAAGKATLELLDDSAYAYLERLGEEVENGLLTATRNNGWPITVNRVGSMFSLFFTSGPVTSVDDVTSSDRERFNSFFHGLLADGVYIAPSAYESSFLSLAHTESHAAAFVEKCVRRLGEVFSTDKHTVQH
jgi:glutamate-1-semialdehyde 2,1-aminomutase